MSTVSKIELAQLYFAYGKLLTQKQNNIIEMYCDFDCSLQEIAECLSISRQGVYDAITTCEKFLLDLEEKLEVIKKAGMYSQAVKTAKLLLEEQKYTQLQMHLNNMANEG